MIARWLAVGAALLLLVASASARAEPNAGDLFERSGRAVAAVRTVEAESGSKHSVGTGFRVGPHEVATNYHVVAGAVLEPERYRLEWVHEGEESEALELLAFDVANDLALLRVERPGTPLSIDAGKLRKGDRIFAVGNPYDIGMSIVEGTYNGHHRHTRSRRIHFTGALNPGMSGGPALRPMGSVVGVNVASAGENVAFLVPVARLVELLERVRAPGYAPPADQRAELRDQLLRFQDAYLDELFVEKPPGVPLGGFRVPGAPAPYFDCWGDRSDDEEDLYESRSHSCTTGDWLFVSNDHILTPVRFQHHQLRSKELATPAFWDLYSSSFEASNSFMLGNGRLYTPFVCRTRFVRSHDDVFKTAFCARSYLELEGLHDVVFKVAALGRGNQGLESSLVLSSVSFENAERVAARFFEEIAWSE